MGPIRKSLNIIKDKFPKNLFNKYLLAFVIFLIWMIFFDSNRVISQWSLQKSVNELEKLILTRIKRNLRERNIICTKKTKTFSLLKNLRKSKHECFSKQRF